MKDITIRTVYNGFNVEVKDADGLREYVYKATEDNLMLEQIGKLLLGRRLEVKDK